MGKLDVEKKRKTAWPVVIGIAIVVLTFWGITTLLAEDAETEPEVTVTTVEDTYPPTAVPAPPDLDPEHTGTDAARSVDEIAPLGEEDVGQSVRLSGEIVATGNETFWIMAGDEVVRVESPREVRKGDTVSIEGTLRPADPEKTDRISDVLERHPASSEWNVIRAIKLVEGGAPATSG